MALRPNLTRQDVEQVEVDPRQHRNTASRHQVLRSLTISLALILVLALVTLAIDPFGSEWILCSTLRRCSGSDHSTRPIKNPRPPPTSGRGEFSSLVGPVIPFNFPDPAILHVDGVTYAFATNNRLSAPSLIHIQVATSHDNHTWHLHTDHDALPSAGSWAFSRGIWAPDIVRLSDGTFVLYYSAEIIERPGTHCVGAALSPPHAPLGPYTPLAEPLACPIELGGAIDADGFLDPRTKKRYIVYKVDGNNIGHGGSCRNGVPPLVPTPLLLQEVSAQDGVTLLGEPIELLDRTDEDGPLIEAPSLYFNARDGIYFLFFSSGCFTTETYDVKYATSTEVQGPYARSSTPLLKSGRFGNQLHSPLLGPGGMDVLTLENSWDDPSTTATRKVSSKRMLSSEAEMNHKSETTRVLFHGILQDHQLPDGYEYESFASQRPMPKRPTGVIRGMYEGRLQFEGRRANFI